MEKLTKKIKPETSAPPLSPTVKKSSKKEISTPVLIVRILVLAGRGVVVSKHHISQQLLISGHDLSTEKCSHNTSLSVSLNQLINAKKMKKSPVIKYGDGYALHPQVTDEFMAEVKTMRNLNWVDPFLSRDYVHELPELLAPVRGASLKPGLFCTHCGMKYLGIKAFNEHRRNYKKQKGREHPLKEECVKDICIQNLKPKGKVSSQQRIRVVDPNLPCVELQVRDDEFGDEDFDIEEPFEDEDGEFFEKEIFEVKSERKRKHSSTKADRKHDREEEEVAEFLEMLHGESKSSNSSNCA